MSDFTESGVRGISLPAGGGGGDGGGEEERMGDGRSSVQAATRGVSRLEEALEELERLRSRVSELDELVAAKDEALDAAERRRVIEAAVVEAGAVDVEAVSLLTAVAIEGMERPDVEAVVSELRAERPYLFHGGSRRAYGGAAMAPAGGGLETLSEAAEEAASSGDRNALLRYMRMRRGSV